MPPALRGALVFASIGTTVLRGAEALVTKGVSVEVLDAAAVGVPALRGKFGTAATTSLILSLAAFIEQRASARSDDLVRSLLRAAPERVWVEVDGVTRAVAYADLAVGDHVVVGPGELVPVDGVVHCGAGTIDSAAVTGESIPIPIEANARVVSGSVLLDGRLVIAADRVGDATTTVRISRFIERALAERSDLQRLADRMADQRVWITFGTAAGVYALTRSMGRVETISLVDFSCTTRLGAAVAIKGAIFQAGQHGLLLKGGDALDKLAHVDSVVFDKTGTLTESRLEIVDVVSFDEKRWPRDRLVALAASLAEHTSHPVAGSVVALAEAEGLQHIGHEDIDFMIGHGLTSTVDGAEVALGSAHFLTDHQHVDLGDVTDRLNALAEDGATLLHLARDGQPLGAIALRAALRPDAKAVIARLRRLGVKQIVMITGDRSAQAQQVGRLLALDGVYAEAEPEDKAGIIQDIRQSGHSVAFVGDGVNDGPALMAADVGVAMPHAADIARATADIVLLHDRLAGVADAMELSQNALGRLRKTLNLAALGNTAVLVAAATGRISPIAAALLHNGTTLTVLAASWLGRRHLAPGARPPRRAPR